ncbi:rhodanese-like domain-containing protein [Streptococcus sobrinus]|uniref:rhodanese-like domain-containing protein n=3 Tax=Streptococcus sobrinus TaxID=1310 RepID=UPI00030F96D7|nr:rhodanese-like domain-containing protein [Streptococcus sobrinus]
MSQTLINWILVAIILLGFLAWTVGRYFWLRRSAKFINNSDFQDLMHQGQIVDLRAPKSFQDKHILGARNFQIQQFKETLSALRKDKPVLLYDNSRGQAIPRAVSILKKAGFTQVYVLESGFENWTGKTK